MTHQYTTLVDVLNERKHFSTGRVSIVGEHRELSGLSIFEQINQCAHLLKDLGVNKGDFVALSINRSVDLIVTMCAILKLGGVCISVDPDYPLFRKKSIVEIASPKFIVTNNPFDELFKGSKDATIINFRNGELSAYPKVNTDINVYPDDDALILFTSGSTGQPKGVVRNHASLFSIVKKYLNRDEHQVYAQTQSYNFIPSVSQIFGPILAQEKSIIVTNADKVDIFKFLKLIEMHRITTFSLVPSQIESFLSAYLNNQELDLSSLELIRFSGEPLSVDAVNRLAKLLPQVRIVNSYGSTETSGITENSISPASTLENMDLGIPLQDVKLKLFDDNLSEIKKKNTVGKLGVNSPTLLSSFLGQNNELDPKFLTINENQFFLTNDYCYINESRKLVFHGRKDFQAKMNGQRINTLEVEEILSKHDSIETLAIRAEILNKKTFLVCYYTVKTGHQLIGDEFEKYSKNQVSIFSPKYLLELDHMPRLPNGKVDYTSLPAVNVYQRRLTSDLVTPRNKLEKSIVELYKKHLFLYDVGIKDSFFELNGDSLAYMSLVNEIEKIHKVRISWASFSNNPTPEDVSLLIEKNEIKEKFNLNRYSANEGTLVPLTYQQEQVWFLEQLNDQVSAYNESFSFLIKGNFFIDSYKKAFQQLIISYPILTTSYHCDKTLYQKANKADVSPRWHEVNRKQESYESINARDILYPYVVEPFSLSSGLLFRVVIISYKHNEYVLSMIFHHSIIDLWSFDILKKLLSSYYRKFVDNPSAKFHDLPLNPNYFNFSLKQKEESFESSISFWKKKLVSYPYKSTFPEVYQRPVKKNFLGNRVYRVLGNSDELGPALQMIRNKGLTPFNIFFCIYAILLSRYTGQCHLIIGTPFAGRNESMLEEMVGFFANSLPVPVEINESTSFLDLCFSLKALLSDIYDNSDIPISHLVSEMKIQRDTSLNPLFQTLFSYQNLNVEKFELYDTTVERLGIGKVTSKMDVSVTVVDRGDTYDIVFEYDTSLYSVEFINQMADHTVNLAEQLLFCPSEKISLITLDIPKAKEKTIHELASKDTPGNICNLFEQAVGKCPKNIAVKGEGRQISYRQLYQASNIFAGTLSEKGIGNGDLVGLFLDRNIDVIVSMLALFKLGAAYVPLNLDYPQERISAIVSESGLTAVVTKKEKNGSFFSGVPQVVIELDLLIKPIESAQRLYPRENPHNPGLLAYVIYTSGSTGKPKGVAVSHNAVINLLLSLKRAFSADVSASFDTLGVTTIGFDISVLEIFLPLISGSTYVILPKKTLLNPEAFLSILSDSKPNWLQATPTLWELLSPSLLANNVSIPLVLTGGEPISQELANKLVKFSKNAYNMYGPTETTIWCSFNKLERDNDPVIGNVLNGCQMYVMDKNMNPCPVGSTGELYIAGRCLAEGYWNNKELTCQNFLKSSLSDNDEVFRLYKTGDLVTRLSKMQMKFVGRSDNQVKISGYRVELEEIESTMCKHPKVKKSIVLLKKTADSQQYLVAFYLSDDIVLDNEIEVFVKKKLPGYMVPKVTVKVENFPMLPSGKIDKKKLANKDIFPKFETNKARFDDQNFVGEITKLWEAISLLSDVDPRDNFFDMGGSSLNIAIFRSRINHQFCVNIPIIDFFEHSSIEKITSLILKKIADNPGEGSSKKKIKSGSRRKKQDDSLKRRRATKKGENYA